VLNLLNTVWKMRDTDLLKHEINSD